MIRNQNNTPSNKSHKDRNEGTKSGLQILSDQKLAKIKEEYPNIPEHALSIPRYSDKTANKLTKAIIDFLQLNGCQAERISITGRYVDNKRTVTNILGQRKVIGSSKWIPTSGQVGSADISATIEGRSVKIEIKIKDQQSEGQKRYQEQVEASGGIYLIARNFQSFYDWYRSTFEQAQSPINKKGGR